MSIQKLFDGEIDSKAQETGVYFVNTNLLATDQFFEIVASSARMLLAVLGMYFAGLVAYPLDGYKGSYIFWEFVEIHFIYALFGAGFMV